MVLAQLHRTPEALREIWLIDDIEHLLNTQYIFGAVLGELYLQGNDEHNAVKFLQLAQSLTASQAEKKLIATKLETLSRTKMN